MAAARTTYIWYRKKEMKQRTFIFAAICGATVAIAMFLAVRFFLFDPYMASKIQAEAVAEEKRQESENLERDRLVADSIQKLDARSRKSACEGYIGGLREQNLPISTMIAKACSGE